MALPKVAIVGRPNVGKSSLFNWLAGRRISIVDPTAGVTRDRITTTIQVEDRYFDLIDTGGMGIIDHDNLTEDVERQIRYALQEADVVLFLVDIRDGVVPLDEHVAERLRIVQKPIILAANKSDDAKLDLNVHEFYRLGYGQPLILSAEQKRGHEALLAAILEHLPAEGETKPPTQVELKIAIVGRRNVGKSTFINSLAQAERVIVSEVAGTTRDSIDVRFERDGKTFLAIDTAGVRKKKSLAGDIEFYSMHRAERSIRRADVVLHFFDPRVRISRVDKQLAEYILENDKPAIFVVNKWDLAKDRMPTERWAKYLRDVFPMLDYVPIAFITASEGKNVYRLLNLAQQLHKQAAKRVKTHELNRVLQAAYAANSPPLRYNRQGKIYYAVQSGIHPPTIVLITNGPDLFDATYQRYLVKALRDHFPFREVAIKLVLRQRGESSGGQANLPELAELASSTDASRSLPPETALLSSTSPYEDATWEVPALRDEPVEDEALESVVEAQLEVNQGEESYPAEDPSKDHDAAASKDQATRLDTPILRSSASPAANAAKPTRPTPPKTGTASPESNPKVNPNTPKAKKPPAPKRKPKTKPKDTWDF